MEKRTYEAIVFRFEPFLEKTEWVLVIEEKRFACFPSSEPLSAERRLILLTFYQYIV